MPAPAPDPLLAILRRLMPLDPAALTAAERHAAFEKIPLHRAFVDLGLVPEDETYRALAETHGLDFVDLADLEVAPETLANVPSRLALEHRFAPLDLERHTLLAAFAEPPPPAELGRLRLLLGRRVRPYLCTPGALRDFARRHYGLGADTLQRLRPASAPAAAAGETVFEVGDGASPADDATLAHFVDQLLAEALRLEASDVHLEPFADSVKLRYRIDGLLRDVPLPEGLHAHHAALVSRLKIMAELDITERRTPHDGRIALSRGGAPHDLRVSILPTPHGETICLRVLGRGRLLLELGALGMEPAQQALLEELAALPQGLALVTGPTGSGKTTTLYSLLARARDGRRKLVTIEDPVEYQLEGVTQVQTRPALGLDFASGLRSVLRHDPDVILIGEIRDRETAEVALRSAQTGHLVFSTLHTNDSIGALARLIDLGIEPWAVGASLVCSVAQRLARRVCPACTEPDPDLSPEIRAEMATALGLAPEAVRARRGRGCPACLGVGERGRVAIYEIFLVTDEVIDALAQPLRTVALRELARRQGWQSLRESAWRKVQDGVVSVAETQRLTRRLQLHG